MSQFIQDINRLEYKMKEHEELLDKIKKLAEDVSDLNKQSAVMLEAQQILSVISEQNTNYVLDYITGIINKALSELFPYDSQKVYLEKSIHAGKYPHIKVKLLTSTGEVRDLVMQCGTGERQAISFLFVLCLIELRKCRRILLMDEILSGLHQSAKKVIQGIMQIFAEEGFQFVFIEHSGMESFGRRYLVEKPDTTATITLIEGEYKDEIFMFNRPVEEVDMSIKEEYEGEEEVSYSDVVSQEL